MSSVVEIPAKDELQYAESLWVLTFRKLRRHRSAQIGAFLITILLLVAIFAPVIAPYDPTQVLIGVEDVKRRSDPCIHALGCSTDQPQHIMGTDGNVRDVFSRIVYGTRISLRIGFITVGFSVVVGTILGAVAGYSGGFLDNLIMRFMDVVLAFPFLLLAIFITFILSESLKGVPGGRLTTAMLAIAIVSVPSYARIIRSTVLSVREMEYVEASRAAGATNFQILFKRILPNASPPLIVQATLGIATAIIETAALSFLGLGATEPTPEWGMMLGTERNQLFSAPHLVLFPGLAIMITVLAFNLLGDGLRDALDPRLMRGGRA